MNFILTQSFFNTLFIPIKPKKKKKKRRKLYSSKKYRIMARAHLLLCFTILFASVTLLDVVSATLKLKPALPQIADPQTVNDVEPYTIKVVMVFVGDLEKECPKTNKFKMFFEKLRGFAKYVCPIKRFSQKDYDVDMKAKAGGLFQAISSFAIGKVSVGSYIIIFF